jgi:hypothetical protein
MRPICYFLLFILVSCREKVTFNDALEITVGIINRKELENKINAIQIKEQYLDFKRHKIEISDIEFKVWNFKNVNNNDIYLFSDNEWNVLLANCAINDRLEYWARDDTYEIESQLYSPRTIKLKKGDEFFIYFNHRQEGGTQILHSIHKLKYFDTNDSVFNTIWIRYPQLKIYRSHLDYIKENKKYFTEKRFSELYESIVYSDSISLNSESKKESEALFLKSIRSNN